MGRRSRHSAKTGDQSLYKNRNNTTTNQDENDDSDNDPMYDEVDRYNNKLQEENYLQLDVSDKEDNSSSEEDDGITTKREGVFDLGMDDEGDSSSDDNDSSEEDEEEDDGRQTKQKDIEQASSSSSDSDDNSDSEDDEEEDKTSKLFNWGTTKSSYYHGDTADLEIGQSVNDAYLEEEAGREVELARLDELDDMDFMLDDDDDGDGDGGSGGSEEGSVEKVSSKKRKSKSTTSTTSTTLITKKKQTPSSKKLSTKEKLKVLKSQHPELLPLITHFNNPINELNDTTLLACGALLKGGVCKGKKEAEAVGATPAGLQYLITKSMLQASKALNLSLYLLLKSDQASKKNDTSNMASSLMDDDDDNADDIRNHPVMERLNQLSQLTDKLHEGVESKIPGLDDQMTSLVKAATLMAGGDLSSSDSEDEGDGEDEDAGSDASGIQDEEENLSSLIEQPAGKEEDSSSESDDEESHEAIQRRIMTEARYALRHHDAATDYQDTSSKKRKRRLAPPSSDFDYGDEAEDNDRAISASRNLSSRMNSIVQKSNTTNGKKNKNDEIEEDEDYERLQRGLSMMEEQFGKGSDDEEDDDLEDDEGLGSDEEDDFYKLIKSKSKAKKEAKKAMYEVKPKYPRLEGEVEGERAIGRTIMKNRGLVAHKAKINRNPRVKKREQYRKALIRRKGAVREMRTDEGHVYAGEATGVKSGISRSRKFK